MTSPVVTCPRCGSTHLSLQPSGTLCLSCLSRRMLERSAAPEISRAPTDGADSPVLAAPAALAIPDRLGAYEIIEELGRGGMGIVYSARHVELDRVVALKIIRRGEWATPEDEARFLREAQAAAKLRHAGIVTIFDVGRHGAWSFYAMDYLEGGDLAQLAARGPVPIRRAVELVAAVAPAIAHAHALGIVHRDLKPSNLLLDAEGRPYVADFGLARWTNEAAELTRTGLILGSPAYMAPEQAAGNATPASDVYGLGAILFFLLTGRAPHEGTTAEILTRAARDDAASPSSHRAELPPALDAVCRRALARDPAQRYPSAAAFGDDLTAWLAGRPVAAALPAPAQARELFAQVSARLAKEGVEHWNQAGMIDTLATATRLDPDFAEAWALQARIHCQVVDFSFDTSDARRESARAALARAHALAPRHPDVRATAGGLAVTLDGDFTTGLRLYRELAEEFPHDFDAAFRLGRLARRMGRWREGNAMMARALRLQPDNVYGRTVASFGFNCVRDFPQAGALIDEAVRLDANDYQRRCFQIWFRWQRDPLPSRALQEIRALPADMRRLRDVAWIECQFLLAEERFAEAFAVYRAATATISEHAIQVLHERTFELRLARLARDEAAPALETALRALLAPGRLPGELNGDQHRMLAHAYAVLGDAAACHRHLDPVVARADAGSLAGARTLGHNEFFAVPGAVINLALLGENEAALAAVARLLNVPGAIDVRTLAFEPAFAALRADPRFDPLLAQAQFPIAAQDGPETLAAAALPLPPLVSPAETEARALAETARQRILGEGIQGSNMEAITDSLGRAVQLAPDFAAAWGLLARVHLAVWGSSFDGSDARRALALEALRRAVALDPQDPDVRSAQAGFLSQIQKDRPGALALYRAIATDRPDSVYHQMAYARFCWSVGHWRTGNAALLQCARLQPTVAQHLQLVAYGCAAVRDFRNAKTWIEAACRVDSAPLWRRLARLWYTWQNDPEPAALLAHYAEWFTAEERTGDVVAWLAVQFHLARHDPAAARAALSARPASTDTLDLACELALRLRLERLAGMPAAGATETELRAALAPGRLTANLSAQRTMMIAYVRAVLGDHAETLSLIAEARAACSPGNASQYPRLCGHTEFGGMPGQLMLLALVGENERCLAELAQWINVPLAVDLRCLAFDPAFAALRADPRFNELLATAQAPIEADETAIAPAPAASS